mgnify:CR=1 FL=1
MEEDIKNLRVEVEVLKKRVEALEKSERHRKILSIIRFVIVFILIVAIVLAGIYFYQQMQNYYNQLNNVINNPFDMFSGFDLPTF